jgi:hypothetical protein
VLADTSSHVQENTSPALYSYIRSNKVKAFDKDIEKLSKTKEEKDQASKLWVELKTELKWNEDLEEALYALQDRYSRSIDSNPPKLCEKLLREYAAFLGELGILKGWLSPERVNNLILVWKRLVECGEKA